MIPTRPAPLEGCSPDLVQSIANLGDEYGPAGVAKVAAALAASGGQAWLDYERRRQAAAEDAAATALQVRPDPDGPGRAAAIAAAVTAALAALDEEMHRPTLDLRPAPEEAAR